MHRPSPLPPTAGPNTADGGAKTRTGADTLWTYNRCNRNNEAKYDACRHCRSPAPPPQLGGGNGSAVGGRPVSGNPFQRYLPKKNSGGPSGTEGGDGTGARSGATWTKGNQLQERAMAEDCAWDTDRYHINQSHADFMTDELFPELHHCGTHNNGFDGGGGGGGQPRANRYLSHSTSKQQQRQAPLPRVPIDKEAAKTWIYPVNYPVREYQLQIVTAALYKNTLVSLPTGLGKTLIAAVVMYNFYRWFPEGKVVFLAPTKPLVAQQISACYDIMGVPESDTAELQGSVTPEKRRALWDERRVFYCTPQSMANDIKHKRCDPGRFVCVVVDEAHRGTGNYAYVNVIREVAAATSHFRILALSATPGSDIKTIQQVLINLRISHIECRSEDDREVAKHTHARQIEVVKCKLGSHIDAIRQGLVAVLQPLVSKMVDRRVLYTRDPMALKAWTVIQCLHTFRRTAQESGQGYMAFEVESDMAILTKVVQAKDTLITHGATGCLQKLSGMEYEVSRRGFRSNSERSVMQHPEWAGLMKLLRKTAENTSGLSIKHPKLIKLKEVLLEHFARHETAGKSTRAIVFTHLRDSVEEITEFLAGEELLRVKAFIGQGNSSGAKAQAVAAAEAAIAAKERQGEEGEDDEAVVAPKQRLKGQTQKEQKAVVKAFFSGEFNCLVATCIAEEGLDIGEVDLIVSFDALNSPVRMVQRMGRTGRKRAGKVVVLVAEGSEESKLRNSNSRSKSIIKALQDRKDKFNLFKGDDPMVPPGPRPRMVLKEMVIVEYHLSQVGGHKRTEKPRRKTSAAGVGRRRSAKSGSSNCSDGTDDWRLTPAQTATLREAYMEEPEAQRYIPNPTYGWKHQRNRWAAGNVARSARSKALCGLRDFIEHQEWELLYDPSDMQLVMANWHNHDSENNGSEGSNPRQPRTASPLTNAMPATDAMPTPAIPSRQPSAVNVAADCDVAASDETPIADTGRDSSGGGGSGCEMPSAGDVCSKASSAVVAGSVSDAEVMVFQVRTTTGQKRLNLGSNGKGALSRGETSESGRRGDEEHGPVKGREHPRPRRSEPASSKTKRMSGSRGSTSGDCCDVNGDKQANAPVGCTPNASASATTEAAGGALGALQTAEVQPNKNGSRIATFTPTTTDMMERGKEWEGTELGRGPDERTQTDDDRGRLAPTGDDDDEETQSDPESGRRCRPAAAATTFCKAVIGANHASRGRNGGADDDAHTAVVKSAQVLPPREQQRWRCGCGSILKAGRTTCRLCGSTPTAAAAAAAAVGEASPAWTTPCPSHLYCETSSLHVKDAAKNANNQTHAPPTDQAGEFFSSTSHSPASCCASSSSSGRSTGGGSTRDDALKTSVSSRKISGKTCQGKASNRKQKSGNCRWQCGCGCSMKAGGKQCVMCGQPRPPGHLSTSVVRSTGGGTVVDDGGSSSLEIAGSDMAGGGIGGGHGSTTAAREYSGTALDSAEAGTRPGEGVSSARGDGCSTQNRSRAVAAHDGEGGGRWQCTRCGNEYGPARLKCRACKIPKLIAENGDQAARLNTRPDVSQSKETDQGGGGTSSTVGFGATEHREESPDQAETNSLSNAGKERGIEEEKIPEAFAVAAAEALHSVVGHDSGKVFCRKQKEDPPVISAGDLCAGVDRHSSSAATVEAIRHPRLGTSDYTAYCAAPATAALLREQKQQRTPQSLPRATGERSGYGNGGGNSDEHIECVDETFTKDAARYGHGAGAGSAGPVDLGPSQMTQDNQDDNGFAELFPLLHRFEEEEGTMSSVGGGRRDYVGVTSQGGRTSMTDLAGNASNRTEGCITAMRSPLIPSPPPLLSDPPTLATAGATPRSPPSSSVSLPMPPILASAQTSTRSMSSPKSLPPAGSSGTMEAAVSAGDDAASAAPPTDAIAQSVQQPTEEVFLPAAPPTPPGRLYQTNDESHVRGEEHEPGSTASRVQQGSGCIWPERTEENGNDKWEDARENTEAEDAGAEQPTLLDKDHEQARETGITPSADGSERRDSSKAHTCLTAAATAPARGILTGKSATKRTSGDFDQDEILDEGEGAYVGESCAERPKDSDGENDISGGHLQEKGAAHSSRQEEGNQFNNSIGSDSSQQRSGDSSGGGEGGAIPEDEEDDEEDDGVCCGVCGGATPMDDDPIILCDGERCNTAVHADCYGVVEVPEGPWLCDPCCSGQQSDGRPQISPSCNGTADSATRVVTTANEASNGQKRARSVSQQSSSANFATCVLCNRKGGALKLSQCGQWAHVVCVWWTPELTSDPETARPGLLSKIDPERASLTCARCHERGGAAVQCAVPHCLQACHPFCALRAGFLLREHDGVFEQYCRTHSRRERRKVNERTAASVVSRDEHETSGNGGGPRGTTCDRGRVSAAGGEGRDEGHKIVADTSSAAGTAERSVLIPSPTPGMLCWQSQAESPVVSSSGPSVRRRQRKQALMSEESDDGDDGGQSPLLSAKRAVSPPVGARVLARKSDEKDTPLKMFDMAPPGLRVKHLLRGGGRGGERSRSCGYGSPTHWACARSDGGSGGERDCGGGDDLVTLSQAISPVDREGQNVKRRRLVKSADFSSEEATKGVSKSKMKEEWVRNVPEDAMPTDEGNGSKGKGKDRSRDFDKATYRRYIDHEAEVDDDVSDDDEAELDDFYDSQDSFVNDGPMSYETSSSQEDEGDTPSSSRNTQCDDDEDSNGGKVGRSKGKGKGKKRLMDNEDEKGMYLELLAHSQLPARPRRTPASSSNRDRGGAIQSSDDSAGGRPAQRANDCGRARGDGRCAFINAVMNHARDGGDPFDIESACGSDADLDNTQTPTQTKRTPAEDSARSLGKTGVGFMFASAEQDVVDPTYSDGEPEEEPMYSQAMRQTQRPGCPQFSPAVRQEPAPAPPPAPQSSCGMSNQPSRADSDEGLGKGKENCRPGSGGLMPAVSFEGFAPANAGDSTSALEKASVKSRDIVRTQNETTRREALRPAIPPGQKHTSATRTGQNDSAENRTATSTAVDTVVRVSQHAAVATACSSSSASLSSASNNGSDKGLTAQQRQNIMENRAKALARLKQKQASRAGVAADRGGGPGAGSLEQAGLNSLRLPGSGPDVSIGDFARGNTCASSVVKPKPRVKRSRLSLLPNNPLSRQHTNMNAARTTAAVSMTQQRGKFRMTMDMDDSDDEEDGPPKSPIAAPARAETRSGLACGHVAMKMPVGVVASKGRHTKVPVAPADMVMKTARDANHVALPSKGKGSTAVVQTSQQHERRPSPYLSLSSAPTNAIHPSPPRSPSSLHPTLPTAANPEVTAGISATSQSSSSATSTTPAAIVTTATIPLSAPRAGALEALARELRSRPGLAVHACTLGGSSGGGGGVPPLLRNVDLVAGVQCAVCVRSRRQFVAQVLGRKSASSLLSSPSCLTGTPVGSCQSSSPHGDVPLSSESQQPWQKSRTGNGYGGTGASSSPEKSPFSALLQANLQRYARVVVIVEGLDEKDDSRDGGSDGDMREAIAIVEALRGVSVFLSRGWKETADRVVALVAEEASAGLGLPCEVTGPSLSAAQIKFLCFLLKAPTLSYPGGLFLLQAFRGRSVKDVIGSAAREFQTAVPGMTGQQAARLKRFLVSAGTSPRPTINIASNGKNGGGASSQAGSVAGFKTS